MSETCTYGASRGGQAITNNGFAGEAYIRTWPFAGISSNGAAQESNLPSDGLRRLTGFEDRLGHRARAAPGPA
jgi:hypothetical protein